MLQHGGHIFDGVELAQVARLTERLDRVVAVVLRMPERGREGTPRFLLLERGRPVGAESGGGGAAGADLVGFGDDVGVLVDEGDQVVDAGLLGADGLVCGEQPVGVVGSKSWWLSALKEAELGHKSAAMTLDIYADLFEDDLDGVAEALELAAMEVRR
ncbi:hypothetical protein FJ658_00720 [Schumannella sp. 10F1B-5-1]|nr:hypothetical protein FJ658_00720 [Schumannella sp. 10F1B-5-1]